MEHLNYCRQMVKQFSGMLSNPGYREALAENSGMVSHFIDLAHASTKFIMPDGGVILGDPELRGLDESMPLHLPHPFIAIEYTRSPRTHLQPSRNGDYQPTKGLLFAREREDDIVIAPCVWTEFGAWLPYPDATIPKVDYLDRTNPRGRGVGFHLKAPGNPGHHSYASEASALLELLNALACSNVRATKSSAKKASKPKGALPFDDYHVLMIEVGRSSEGGPGFGGSRRSPREHLRRGHIRRLSSGERIWINATAVAAGRGAGVIRKDYAVQRQAP